MKFLITLIISFNGEISPKVYTYQFMDFTDYKTSIKDCERAYVSGLDLL